MGIRSDTRAWLEARSAALMFAAGVALVAVIGAADYWTSEEFSLAVFYLVPVLGAAWLSGKGSGMALAALAAVTSVAADLGATLEYPLPIHLWNLAMRLGFFMVAAALHAQLRRVLLREHALARRDPLTGLGNRTAFGEAARAEIDRSLRHGRPLTVATFDLDHFKRVNDSQGHEAGDRVLHEVGARLRQTIRKTDVAARLGGDEFAILFPELAGAEAREVVEKLRARLLSAMAEGGWPVTFSVGVVSFAQAPATLDGLLHRPDELLYEVKRSGRNGLLFEESPAPAPALLAAS